METYFSNQPLTISVPLVTGNGDAVTEATNGSFRVVDAAGIVVAAPAVIDVTDGTGLVSVAVGASANTLLVGEVRAYRQVELTFDAGGMTFTTFQEYVIESVDALIVLTNSFQTYGDSMLLSAEMNGIELLTDATRRERITALISAFRVLSGLNYDLGWNTKANFTTMTVEEFNLLPARFLLAVKQAQVIEASEALDMYSIQKKRQSGLMSETIGESSMMFRPEKVLNIPVTHRSLDMLRPWLVWELGIGRG